MNKSAAGSRHFSHSHSGISASGIGGVGGSLCQLITERVNFVVFLHIATASPKCTVSYTMVTEIQSNAFCFHFPVFYKKHAFSLFCSSIQGLCILCVRHWEHISSWWKNTSSEYHFRRSIFCLQLCCFWCCHTFRSQRILAKFLQQNQDSSSPTKVGFHLDLQRRASRVRRFSGARSTTDEFDLCAR